MTTVDDQPWMIVQNKVTINDKTSSFVFCDRRLHLLIIQQEANKNAPSANSTVNIPDPSGVPHTRSVAVQTVSKLNLILFSRDNQ